MQKLTLYSLNALVILTPLLVFNFLASCSDHESKTISSSVVTSVRRDADWKAPDTSLIPQNSEGDLIRYGRDIIVNTCLYFGPHGRISTKANGMNCQNCHLEAGTKAWGNNYGGVYSTYPKFRERRGAIETIYQRINDCFQRSLNGAQLDTNCREIKAIYAYMKWLGQNVEKGKKPKGCGIQQLGFLDRPADPEKGKIVYKSVCMRCHGNSGQGTLKPDSLSYLYPPLWGPHSYSTGAGLYRLSRFAGYVHDNMPFGTSHYAAQLKNEDAWDVAAFVNSQPRPVKIIKIDWPDISLKPVDHPLGPYADSFSELQHKYGPYGPIQKAKELKAGLLISSTKTDKESKGSKTSR
ncbi:MAG: cytochrome C [Bacteroidetes bacterium]|nr:MAG: cytochrome C [Bacteroidota bacterium]